MKLSDVPRCPALLMCGISGSGKTYHALRLEAEGYVRVSVDAIIWKRFGNQMDSLSPDERKTAFMEANNEAWEEAVGLLKNGRKVVVDATHCKRAARDRIRRLCAEQDVQPIFLYLHAPKEILWERLAHRKGEGPDDLPVSREQLDGYCLGFQRPEEDETDVITIEEI